MVHRAYVKMSSIMSGAVPCKWGALKVMVNSSLGSGENLDDFICQYANSG